MIVGTDVVSGPPGHGAVAGHVLVVPKPFQQVDELGELAQRREQAERLQHHLGRDVAVVMSNPAASSRSTKLLPGVRAST